MALEKLSLRAIANLDCGRVREAFNQALERCRRDCDDRPGVDQARKVTLTVAMKPLTDDERPELESCDVNFVVHESIPKRPSKTYNMAARANGLWFNDLSPDDANQQTIDQIEKVEEKEER